MDKNKKFEEITPVTDCMLDEKKLDTDPKNNSKMDNLISKANELKMYNEYLEKENTQLKKENTQLKKERKVQNLTNNFYLLLFNAITNFTALSNEIKEINNELEEGE